MNHYILVVDTEQYAGNFEREMCAYITGQTGDCGVGGDVAANFSDVIQNIDWWNEHVKKLPDEHNIFRPVTLYATDGWYNNGFGRHFKNERPTIRKKYPAYLSVAVYMNAEPPQEVIDEFTERAKSFCEVYKKIDAMTCKSSYIDCPSVLTFKGVRLLMITK